MVRPWGYAGLHPGKPSVAALEALGHALELGAGVGLGVEEGSLRELVDPQAAPVQVQGQEG